MNFVDLRIVYYMTALYRMGHDGESYTGYNLYYFSSWRQAATAAERLETTGGFYMRGVGLQLGQDTYRKIILTPVSKSQSILISLCKDVWGEGEIYKVLRSAGIEESRVNAFASICLDPERTVSELYGPLIKDDLLNYQVVPASWVRWFDWWY